MNWLVCNRHGAISMGADWKQQHMFRFFFVLLQIPTVQDGHYCMGC